MCSTNTPSTTQEGKKLVKFVELLVHDYLQAKGFQATGAKFAEECSTDSRDDVPVPTGDDGSAGVDEASSWYGLADKLALPVRLSGQEASLATLGS